MKVCVYGLWHLGSVTAACLAEHFLTVGCDPDEETVAKLRTAHPPVFEPGLAELLQAGLSGGRLNFSSDPTVAVRDADIVWITFDTPVDDDDVADVLSVERQLVALFPHLIGRKLVLVSSQVPVGFTARIEQAFRQTYPDRQVSFAYSPENLRLGKALDAFCRPERIIVGVRNQEDRKFLTPLLAPFCDRLEWMSIESAEMTKHAINAFLATSIALTNEIAALCEQVDADAKEVERGLRTEPRIGPRAYVSPGSAFAGGTLARDIAFLTTIGHHADTPTSLLSGVRASNDEHRWWPRRKLRELLSDLRGRNVAILGLTYKPNTNTLRRSSAVELCLALGREGAHIRAYDPAVDQLPVELSQHIGLCRTALEVLHRADAAIIATEWPVFRTLRADEVISTMRTPIIVDPNRFLATTLGNDARLRYYVVGKPRIVT